MINYQKANIILYYRKGNHPKHIIELSKHYRNIIVEKPISLSVKEERIINICKNNSRLFVVKQNRFNHSYTTKSY